MNKKDTTSREPVIPMSQTEICDDGSVVTKRVKPLTYSLMYWVKCHMNLPDTINISGDEDTAQFELSVSSSNENYSYSCFFNTDEENGYIMFYLYYFDDQITEEKENTVKDFILDRNLQCITGQVQLYEGEFGKLIRYYSGICVKGIASQDPDYSGEFQISPILFKNMFENGVDFMNIFIEELKEIINND